MEVEDVASATREYDVDRPVHHVGKTITSKMSYADMATSQLTTWWNRLPTFPTISSPTIGAEGGNKTLSDRYREKEIEDNKECTLPTVQASTLLTIYRQNSNKYPGYRAKLSLICQREKYRPLVTVHWRSIDVCKW